MTIIVNITDTFEEWRLKNNELATDVANLSNNVYTINVIASGNITAGGNIFALGNTVVSHDIVGAGNLRLSQDALITGNVTAANIRANVHYQTHVTSKPAINVIFTGNITGSSNIAVANSGTNILTISANVAADSVTLGTHTVGDYVKSISSADTNNVIVSSGSGEGSTPTVNLAMTAVTPAVYGNSSVTPSFTVDRSGRITAASNNLITPHYLDVTNKPSINVNFIGDATGKSNVNLSNNNTNTIDTTLTLAASGVAAATYGNASIVPIVTVDAKGRITGAANATIAPHYLNVTNKPAVNLTFKGDVTGTANLNLTNDNTNQLDVTLTMNADSITLGTDTTGNYTNRVEPGTMITVSGTADEGNVITINHSDTSTLNGAQGGSGIAAFTVDDRGHVTAVTTATYLTDTVTTTAASYGNANVVSQIVLDTKGRVTSAANVAIDRDYALTTRKPSINLRFVGEATGNGNITVSNSDKNELVIDMTVATIGSGTLPDTAVSPGTYGGSNVFAAFTVDSKGRLIAASNVAMGDYVKSISSADSANIVVSNGTGQGSTPTVNLAMTAVTPGSYGNASVASQITVDRAGRVTSASNVKITPLYLDITNKPAVNINFTGDVTGKANVNLSSNNTNLVDVALTIAADSVALGTDTTGNYTNRVVAGTGISATGTVDEGNVITVGLTNTAVTPTTYGNATIVPVFTVDQQGRITSASNVSITAGGSGAIGICNSNNLTSTTLTTHTNIAGACHNFFAGVDAGKNITTGSFNTFFGFGAGCCNTLGSDNVFIGLYSGKNNQSGLKNIFVGNSAGTNNATGEWNVVLGTSAGLCMTSACYNVILGGNSARKITSGNYNLIFGVEGGYNTTTGCNNFFAGYRAGYVNTTGDNNIFLGQCSGRLITTGARNISFGRFSGANVTTGNDNIIFGCLASCAGFTCSTSNVIVMATGGIQRFEIDSNCNNIIMGTCAGLSNETGSNNFFAGACAGYCNKQSNHNIFIGQNAGFCSGSTPAFSGGYDNIYLGRNSAYSSTLGYNNFVAGPNAGYRLTSGNNNFLAGAGAGCALTTGSHNIIIGCLAGNNCLAGGCNNVFLGQQAGCRNASYDNTFIGRYAGQLALTGSYNTFIGVSAGRYNQSGQRNHFFGINAGRHNGSGSDNIFLGFHSGYCNTDASHNFFAGFCAGRNNITGAQNTFIGNQAGFNNTTGGNNIYIGQSAGYANTGGENNTFLGYQAGYCNTYGCMNTYIGYQAGYRSETAQNNNFMGFQAGCANTTGSGNQFFGNGAGLKNTTGSANFFFGSYTGCSNTTGCNNVFIGSSAGIRNTIGTYNIAAGRCAGRCLVSGSRNITLGHLSGANVETGNDNIILGCLSSCAGLTSSTSNVIIMATGGSRKVFFDSTGNAGVGTSVTTPTATWDVGGNLKISGAVTQSVYTLSGTTPALNPTNGTIQTWTLTGTSSPTDSFGNGQSMTLLIDDGSAYTITWPSVTWKTDTGSAPTLLTTGNTVIALWKVNSVLYGARVGNN